MRALFLFFSEGEDKYHFMNRDKDFCHVAVVCEERNKLTVFESSQYGIAFRSVRVDWDSFINKAPLAKTLTHYLACEVDVSQCRLSPIFIKVFSCNEICRYMSGVDIGITLNPKHFYNKLIDNSSTSNYEILKLWARETVTKAKTNLMQ